jgi:hypothetical protein
MKPLPILSMVTVMPASRAQRVTRSRPCLSRSVSAGGRRRPWAWRRSRQLHQRGPEAVAVDAQSCGGAAVVGLSAGRICGVPATVSVNFSNPSSAATISLTPSTTRLVLPAGESLEIVADNHPVNLTVVNADFVVEGRLVMRPGRTLSCLPPQHPPDVTSVCDGGGGGGGVHAGGPGGTCFKAGGIGGAGDGLGGCPGARGGGGRLNQERLNVGGGSGGAGGGVLGVVVGAGRRVIVTSSGGIHVDGGDGTSGRFDTTPNGGGGGGGSGGRLTINGPGGVSIDGALTARGGRGGDGATCNLAQPGGLGGLGGGFATGLAGAPGAPSPGSCNSFDSIGAGGGGGGAGFIQVVAQGGNCSVSAAVVPPPTLSGFACQ